MVAAASPPQVSSNDDLDLQAVEGIPRDTLVALLKRKDKEAKTLAAKLEKLEARYIKQVRFNKILTEDRASFQRFCSQILTESDGVFEEAAAQETPINLDALLLDLEAFRGALASASEDRKVFRQFVELAFAGDEALSNLFKGNSPLGFHTFNTLQKRWASLEDLHNQSIASVNSMAREQLMSRVNELDAALVGRKEAEKKVEEVQAQLTQLHREKAQMLTRRLTGGSEDSTTIVGASPCSIGDASQMTRDASSFMARESTLGPQVRELREALDAAEKRSQEARSAAARREEDLQRLVESHQAEAQRVRQDLARLSEDAERQRTQARALVEEKDITADRLRTKVAELEEELGSNEFIAQLAERQASRDAEMRAKQRQVDNVNQTLADSQRLLTLRANQEAVLKDRIRELESSHGRHHVSGDYLKHVVMKYMMYSQVGDMKAQGLVPVLATLLSLSAEERRAIEQPEVPQPFTLLNQAVGNTTQWLRGGASPTALGLTKGEVADTQNPQEQTLSHECL